MHTFIEEWRWIVVFWEQHRVQIKGKVQGRKLGSVKRYFMRNVFFQTASPAYSMERADMRPVTKITIFGFRLAIVVLAAYWLCIFVGTHLPNM
ncbi:MAG: hypothetical protein GY880_24405, partial [Planctomycetaceae bacterium]|nr:hypothetical protein [Planctomycetaceae bacterium]